MSLLRWCRVLAVGSLVVGIGFTPLKAASQDTILVTLAWDASNDPLVTGYAVYYGPSGGSEMERFDTGTDTKATLPLLVDTAYSIYVVSYTSTGDESAPSTMLTYKPPAIGRLRMERQPDGAVGLKVRTSPGKQCRIEYSAAAGSVWQTLGNFTADSNGDVSTLDGLSGNPKTRFYRGMLP